MTMSPDEFNLFLLPSNDCQLVNKPNIVSNFIGLLSKRFPMTYEILMFAPLERGL